MVAWEVGVWRVNMRRVVSVARRMRRVLDSVVHVLLLGGWGCLGSELGGDWWVWDQRIEVMWVAKSGGRVMVRMMVRDWAERIWRRVECRVAM